MRLLSSSSTDTNVFKLVPFLGPGKHKQKARDQVTPLAGRLFGTYTFLAGLLRIYGAYYIDNPIAYQLALLGFVIAALHFTSELVIYKGIRFEARQAIPFIFSSFGMIWMVRQYRHYTSG